MAVSLLLLTLIAHSWIYGAEISPLKIRSKANSLGIAMQYLFNFVVVEVTPVGIARIGGYYYIPWAISNALICVFLYFFFPEVSYSASHYFAFALLTSDL